MNFVISMFCLYSKQMKCISLCHMYKCKLIIFYRRERRFLQLMLHIHLSTSTNLGITSFCIIHTFLANEIRQVISLVKHIMTVILYSSDKEFGIKCLSYCILPIRSLGLSVCHIVFFR